MARAVAGWGRQSDGGHKCTEIFEDYAHFLQPHLSNHIYLAL